MSFQTDMKAFVFFSLVLSIILGTICDIGSVVVSGLNLRNAITYTAFLSLIVTEFTSKRIRHKRIPALRLLVLTAILLLINIFSVQRQQSMHLPLIDHLRELKDWYLEPVLYFILSFLLVDNKDAARRFLLVFILVISVLNILGLVGLGLGTTVFTNEYYLESGRYTGLGNPNKTSYLLCSMLPFMYYFYTSQNSRILRTVFLGLLFISVLSVAMSGSRGGLLCVVLIAMLLSVFLKDAKPLATMLLLVIPVSILFLSNEMVREKIIMMFERLTLLSDPDVAQVTSYRSEIWTALLKYLEDNPKYYLYGVGFSTTRFHGIHAPAHSFYLRVLFEFGMAGITMLLLILAAVFRFFKKYTNSHHSGIKPFILISISSILLSFCFTDLGMFAYMAFALGLAFSFHYHQNKETSLPNNV